MMTSHWPLKRECGATVLSILRQYIHCTYKVVNRISRKPGLVVRAVSLKSVIYLLKYQGSIDSNNSNCSYGTFTKFCTIHTCTLVVECAKFCGDHVCRILETDISFIVERMRCLVDINITRDFGLSKKQLWKWEITKGRFVPINIKVCQPNGASVN